MSGLKLITAPAEEPVTLAEAKLHCRVDGSADDTLITALIAAARQQGEHRTGRAFVTQTWELALDAFPESEIELPIVPAASITSVKYLDGNEVEQTISSADYAIDSYGLRHWLIPSYGVSWPSTLDAANAVKVRYVAGYGAASAVPEGIKAWILLAVGTLYQNREAVTQGQTGEVPRDFFDGLLDPYRVYRL